jgi:ankyrin repeat protein
MLADKPETSFAVLVHVSAILVCLPGSYCGAQEHNIQASRQQLVAAAHSLSPSPTAIALPPLLVAAASPSIVLLQRQLKLTSDPNITESGPLGRNALHIAALSNQPRNFSLLLKAGVDVCARAKNGTTPLILASMVGHAEIVKIIIEEGKVDPNERDMYQNTPLHAAVVNNHTEVVKILLRHRADPWAVESNGWTPLHVAVVKRFEEMIQVLTQAMEVSNEATQWNSGAITEEMRT